MSDEKMTKSEREELAKLVRRRERLAKADADRVAAERLAEFERQLATIYKPSDDPAWGDAHAAAQEAVAEANATIQARCRELGIQDEFAPRVATGWLGRGGETGISSRRAEIRKVAQTRIAADAKDAKVKIERQSVDVQTQLVAGGLESAEARAFLDSMPTAESLMPPAPSVAEIEGVKS